MTTPPSPRSAEDERSLPSSPTRANTVAAAHLYLPSQAAHAGQLQRCTSSSDALPTPFDPALSGDTPAHSAIETDDSLLTMSQNHMSTVGTQPASPPQESRQDIMPENNQSQSGPDDLWEQSFVLPGSPQDERPDPLKEPPSKDWKGLERRYEREMEAAVQNEQAIMDEIDWVLKMMKESTVASSLTESERAKKRLRTRVAYVQQSEEALAEKRAHYKGVVDAFQNAMALLGGI